MKKGEAAASPFFINAEWPASGYSGRMSGTPSPTLVVLLGPSAVGKMTVGQSLARLTGYPLLFNHMVVDLVTAVAPFGTPAFHTLARDFTAKLIATAAETAPGLVLTHALVFTSPGARQILDGFAAPFFERGGRACFVELSAPLDVRLARNETENRRRHKDTSWATPERLREMEHWGAWHSDDAFWRPGEPHLLVDTTHISPDDAALTIAKHFRLPLAEA